MLAPESELGDTAALSSKGVYPCFQHFQLSGLALFGRTRRDQAADGCDLGTQVRRFLERPFYTTKTLSGLEQTVISVKIVLVFCSSFMLPNRNWLPEVLALRVRPCAR